MSASHSKDLPFESITSICPFRYYANPLPSKIYEFIEKILWMVTSVISVTIHSPLHDVSDCH